MDEIENPLPVRLFAQSVALLGIPAAATIFLVSLIGSGGVGYGPRRTTELLFRAEFMAALVLAALVVGIGLAHLLLRDPGASLQRWIAAGALCGFAVGLGTLIVMVWDMVIHIGVPPELVGNWVIGVVAFTLIGAGAALPIRMLTLYRFNRTR